MSRATHVLAFAVVATLLLGESARTASANANPIVAENARAGTGGWTGAEAFPSPIEGYASEASVMPGETVHFHVSVDPAGAYRVRVFRLGWYGGVGARLVATLDGAGRPQPPTADSDGAHWPVTNELKIPDDWVSGYYLARFEHAGGRATATIFIVRAPAARRSTFLVQVPVNTWQAYNPWGGKSLYDDNSIAGRAARVSFERPYTPGYLQTFEWEIQLIRFLEREGYDVSYQTDIDTHRDPSSLLTHRAVIVASHGEYWSSRIRSAFDVARDAGTNLAFMGANIAYWQIRYENRERTLVGYKSPSDPETDPALRTVLFRELDRHECQLLGVMHQGGLGLTADYVVTAAAGDPWFAATGFEQGTRLPGLLGPEWDTMPSVPPGGCVKPGLTVLFSYGGPPMGAHAVRYVAPSGARVFSAGSMQLTWGLDEFPPRTRGVPSPLNPGVQQFMRNVLEDMSRPAPPVELRASPMSNGFRLTITSGDPRVAQTLVTRDGRLVCAAGGGECIESGLPGHRSYRYDAVSIDEWGRSEQRTFGPFWLPNTSPWITLRGPRKVVPGAMVRYVASARDRDGDTLSFRWRLDGRLLPLRGSRAAVVLTRGRHVLRVEVRDGHGGVAHAACWSRVSEG